MTDKINLDELRADILAGTRGPWIWKGGSAFSVQQGNGPYVARIYMWDVTAKAEADARRIARLPELEQAYLDAIGRAESAESTRDGTKAFFEEYRAFASRLLDEKCTLIARAEAAEAELDRMQSLRLEGPPSDMHWLAEDPEQPLLDAIARAEAAETRAEAAEADRDKLRVLLRAALERDVSGKIRRQMRLDLAALKGSDT